MTKTQGERDVRAEHLTPPLLRIDPGATKPVLLAGGPLHGAHLRRVLVDRLYRTVLNGADHRQLHPAV